MKIVSDDRKVINEIYEKMLDNGEDVTLQKETVEGAMGFKEFIEWLPDIKIDIDLSFTKIFTTWINRHYDYRTQVLLIEKPNGDKGIIDTEVMKEGKPLESLNVEIEEDDIIHIESIEE